MSITVDLEKILFENPIDIESMKPLTKTEDGDGDLRNLFNYNPEFIQWLVDNNTSLVVSSYKTATIYAIGSLKDPRDNQNKLSMWVSSFNRPMGLHTSPHRIWISSSGNLWKYDNVGQQPDKENFGDFDASYIPTMAYFSNDIDAHDICVDKHGNPYYCSATFCCICVPSQTHSFRVFWKPPWISKVAPEDRCHLNGLCSRDGEPRYVSCICMGDAKNSWRDNRVGRGVIYDIKENRVVCKNITMPHSPRWAHGKLWILEAGTGWLGTVNLEKGIFEKLLWIPGYLRGLCFVGDKYMVVGSSEDRHESTFKNLPLGEELKKNGKEAICGFFVVNLRTMKIEHTFQFFSPINELYDVCSVEGITRPKIEQLNNVAYEETV